MKNKKFTIGLTLMLAGSLLFTNCTKNKTNEAPTPDSDVQTTKDMVKIQMMVNDIIDMAGQAGNTASGLLPHLSYAPLSIVSGTNTINSTNATISFSPALYYYDVNFNQTVGKDGHVRSGSLKFDFLKSTIPTVAVPIPPVVTSHCRPFFQASVTAIGYTVDDYSITINSMTIDNSTPIGFPNISPYLPANFNITWNINANITIASPSGTDQFSGTFSQTLLNTNNTAVPMPLIGSQTFTVYQASASNVVQWNKAYLGYTGNGTATVNGTTSSFTLTNCTRNMNSSPEMFFAPGGLFSKPERHPFLSGMMTFKPEGKSIREVNFGTGDVVDYNAKVTIEGVTYDADCRD